MRARDVGDELHSVGAVVAHHNTYEVEPHLGGYGVELHVEVGSLREVGNLLPRERLHGGGQGTFVTCFDLHEVVVTIGGEGYDVDFVWRVAPIALHHNVGVGS